MKNWTFPKLNTSVLKIFFKKRMKDCNKTFVKHISDNRLVSRCARLKSKMIP